MTLRHGTHPRRALAALACLTLLAGWQPAAMRAQSAASGSGTERAHVHLPLVTAAGLRYPGQPSGTYAAIPIAGMPTDRPAAEHPDLNLSLRGYSPTLAATGLVDINGPADPSAPRLSGLLPGLAVPTLTAVYRVNGWDWSRFAVGPPLTSPEVTLIGLCATPGQFVALPPSGYDILGGYQALVLYAAADRLTLKYTREDDVVSGYTVHLEGVKVDPALLALYRACDAAGRRTLPAVTGGQLLGVAAGREVGVAIRDAGTFMDPRSRKDWW